MKVGQKILQTKVQGDAAYSFYARQGKV